MGSVVKDAVFVVVVVSAFLLAYYLAYSLSFTYLRPYMHYYLEVADSHARVFNPAMLIILVSSPFNAYEAVMIHTNPTMYFLESVLTPTVLVLVFLALYELAVYWLGIKPIIEPISFVRFVLLASLVDSWLVSLIRWLWLGAPSIGTSIFTVFQFTAIIYIMIVMITILVTVLIIRTIGAAHSMRIRRSPRLLLTILLAIILIIVIVTLIVWVLVPRIFIIFIPITNVNHVIGLIIAVSFIYAYHVCKVKRITPINQ